MQGQFALDVTASGGQRDTLNNLSCLSQLAKAYKTAVSLWVSKLSQPRRMALAMVRAMVRQGCRVRLVTDPCGACTAVPINAGFPGPAVHRAADGGQAAGQPHYGDPVLEAGQADGPRVGQQHHLAALHVVRVLPEQVTIWTRQRDGRVAVPVLLM